MRLLQHMGCVEIDEPPHLGDDPEKTALTWPDPGALNTARDARSVWRGALRTLKKYGPKQKVAGRSSPGRWSQRRELFDDAAYRGRPGGRRAAGELERRIHRPLCRAEQARTQRLALAPWLALDIPLETASTEVAVSFGTVAALRRPGRAGRELAEKSELTQVLRAGSRHAACNTWCSSATRSAGGGLPGGAQEYGFSQAAPAGWTGTAARTTNGWRPGRRRPPVHWRRPLPRWPASP